MPEQIMEDQIAEVVTQAEEDYGTLIPEHAILRFARFCCRRYRRIWKRKRNNTLAGSGLVSAACRTFDEKITFYYYEHMEENAYERSNLCPIFF